MNKNLKIFVTSILIGGSLLTCSQTAFAATKINPNSLDGIIDLNNLDDSNTEISEDMTHSELIESIQKDLNISKDEALKMIGPDTITVAKDGSVKGNVYRHAKREIAVTSTYRPVVTLYLLMSEGGGYRGYKEIKNGTINLKHKETGKSKNFTGKLYYNLESANQIYFNVDGQFYNHGTTTISVGGSAGLGDFGTATFSVINATNHYAYYHGYDYFKLY